MELSEGLTESHDSSADKLNTLLDNKIGYGFAQEKLSRSLYLLLFSEGCETVVLGLLLPVLTQEWALDTFQQSMMITTVYLGVLLGSYLQVYSDKYGRHPFILWGYRGAEHIWAALLPLLGLPLLPGHPLLLRGGDRSVPAVVGLLHHRDLPGLHAGHAAVKISSVLVGRMPLRLRHRLVLSA